MKAKGMVLIFVLLASCGEPKNKKKQASKNTRGNQEIPSCLQDKLVETREVSLVEGVRLGSQLRVDCSFTDAEFSAGMKEINDEL